MISVCIATYNGEKYIKDQLESILIQLSNDDEIIISDDNSSDNTLAIINSINDSRIKIYNHEKKKSSSPSAYATRNFENALLKAKGDIIFMADQDDVWFPQKVATMCKYLQIYDLVISDAYITDGNLNVIHTTRFYPGCNQTRNIIKSFISTHPYQGSCMAFKNNVLKKALPFPQKVSSHDTWIGFIGATYFKTKLIPEPLMYYRRHENVVSITGEKSHKPIIFKIISRIKYLSLVLLRGLGL